MDKGSKFQRFNFSRLSFSKSKSNKKTNGSTVASAATDAEVNNVTPKKIPQPKTAEKPSEHILKSGSLDAESIPTKSHKSNFFRTPSLPRRLKFKPFETPKKSPQSNNNPKKCSSEKKTKTLPETYDKLGPIEKEMESRKEKINLTTKVFLLEQSILRIQHENKELLAVKDRKIKELEREIENINKADELLQQITSSSLDKIKAMEDDMNEMVRSHEAQLGNFVQEKNRIELLYEETLDMFQTMQEENSQLHNKNHILEQELQQYQETVELKTNEVNGKLEELKFLQKSMEEIMQENASLKNDVKVLKVQSADEILQFIEESRSSLNELDTLRRERANLLNDLRDKQTHINDLYTELAKKQVENDSIYEELRESYNCEVNIVAEKYEERINDLQTTHEDKLKQTETELKRHYEEMINKMEADRIRELDNLNESAEEKVKIAEIQAEEKIKALEASIQGTIAREKSLWQIEMDKCQKIAETEIVKSELEKHELKSLLEATNQLLKERDDTILDMQVAMALSNVPENKISTVYEKKLKEAMHEAARLKTEKYNYQLTLNNTRCTVNILMERLKNSDNDVEVLKQQLDQLESSKVELEQINMRLQEELDQYRKNLSALAKSSKNLEQQIEERQHIYEYVLSADESTIAVVNEFKKSFSEKVEERLTDYMQKYEEILKSRDAQQIYIEDLKKLLTEFTVGIELARTELDLNSKKVNKLETENKILKLENMTFKFRCEQAERQQSQIKPKSNMKRCWSSLDIESSDRYNDFEDHTAKKWKKDDHLNLMGSDTYFNLDLSLKDSRTNMIKENKENQLIKENQELQQQLEELKDLLKSSEQKNNQMSQKYEELVSQMTSISKIKSVLKCPSKTNLIKTMDDKENSTINPADFDLNCLSPQSKSIILNEKLQSPKTPKKLIAANQAKESRSPLGLIRSPIANTIRPRNNHI